MTLQGKTAILREQQLPDLLCLPTKPTRASLGSNSGVLGEMSATNSLTTNFFRGLSSTFIMGAQQPPKRQHITTRIYCITPQKTV
jgi:hypothetical protein